MYNSELFRLINKQVKKSKIDIAADDNLFYTRMVANAAAIEYLFLALYKGHGQSDESFQQLFQVLIAAYKQRSAVLKQKDDEKEAKTNWFLSTELVGMSLYVDRFCGDLKTLEQKLDYFNELGVNLLHLMPLMQSPSNESDGGYAVSDFRKVDERFGTIEHLISVRDKMNLQGLNLMLDIVLNHTSHRHEWAEKAKKGEKKYQDYFYMYDDRKIPDEFEKTMPEIFPEAAPGSFTFVPECNKWVMTVFHQYQWDLNYTNPAVLIEMLDTIFFYANLGVDILRIDAPAFIWKQIGTTCQNLPQAHQILQLIKLCVQIATPGMALLGEAIVAPKEIMKYFGTGLYTARECDFAYNATHMALQWDALATGDTRVMLAAQYELLQKPFGTSWITYTRCHDDIGLAYDDYMIEQAGYQPYGHRKFIKDYYTGNYKGSTARGALFSVNPKTQDARISGTLASLCGLESALENGDTLAIDLAIKKIILMQAHSFFIGGIPMLFYGDETGAINEYEYLNDSSKSYDNRWMHRPALNLDRLEKINVEQSIEAKVFNQTKKLISIRKQLDIISDQKNLVWLPPHNIHIAGFLRTQLDRKFYGIFNFSNEDAYLTWHAFKEHGSIPGKMEDCWTGEVLPVGRDDEYLILPAYSFKLLIA